MDREHASQNIETPGKVKAMRNEKKQQKTGKGYWLVPFLFALPLVIALLWVSLTYGETLGELILAGCKVVLVR